MPDKVLWDAAIHVYDDAYPCRPGLTTRPPHAPIAHYLSAHAQIGITNIVLSQASAYGFDNSLLLDTLDTLSGRGRGIVVLPPTVPLRDLQDLHRRGVRGIRFMMFEGGALRWEDAAPWATIAAELNWVLKFQIDTPQFEAQAAFLASLPARLVIDLYPGTLDFTHETIDRLRHIMHQGKTWLSLTAPKGPADRAFDMMALALLTSHPDKCLWASNWPQGMAEPRNSVPKGLSWLSDVAGPEIAAIVLANPAGLFE